MHWEWVVPVIALVLWILNNLIRSADDKRARNAQRGAELENEQPAEQPKSDVDQFLEEINRMRRRTEPPRRQEPPEVLRAEEPPRPSAPPRPVYVPTVVETPRPERPRPRPAQRPRTQVARPVVPKPGAEILDVIPVAAPVAPHKAPTVSAPARQPSPAVIQLRSMLRSPGTIQAAIILQEVLGPPRCRRGRKV
jgi:hypothetical protein